MTMKSGTEWLLALLVLLSFSLGIYQLDSQSLWYDEGVSAYLTYLSLSELTLWTAEDIQPPLYYYLLYLWVKAAGRSEFSLRFLSLFFGVLLVPGIWGLTTELLGRKAGLLAALFAALSPLYLWYSREARMYTMLTFFSVLSLRLFLEIRGRVFSPLIFSAWVVSLVAALYTHYFAAFLMASMAFMVLPLLLEKRVGTVVYLISGKGIALALYLPWLPFLFRRYHVDVSYWEGTLKVGEALRKIFISFSVGETMLEDKAAPIAWAMAGLFLVSLILLAFRKGQAALFLSFYFFVPLISILALTYRSPKFNPRYLMLESPAFLITIAGGLVELLRLRLKVVFFLGLSLVLVSSLLSDYNLYSDPAFTKADFRGVARYLQKHQQPDEAIILISGHMYPVFSYYFGNSGWTPLPPLRILSTREVLDFRVGEDLNRILKGKKGVWVVLWQDEVVDPNSVVVRLLEKYARSIPVDSSFWHVRLRHYSIPPDAHFPSFPEPEHQVNANFGGKIKLLGYDWDGKSLTLYWQALSSMEKDYQLCLRVTDENGIFWGQADQRPASYLYPTFRWRPGELIPGEVKLPLPPGAPPGKYRLFLSLYETQTLRWLELLDSMGAPQGVQAFLGEVEVEELQVLAPGEALPLSPNLDILLTPEIVLRGFSLSPSEAYPGQTLTLTFLWEVKQKPRTDYQVSIRLKDSAGNVKERLCPPAGESFPTSSWPSGAVVLGKCLLRVPPSASGGPATVLLLTPEASWPLATVQVRGIKRNFTLPTPSIPLKASFGNVTELLGIDLSPIPAKPGERLTVTLYWKALGEAERAWTVFVHLLGPDGRLIAQDDSPPARGERPTTSWVAGEVIEDQHFIVLPPDIHPGLYSLEIGLYDGTAPGMPRLPTDGKDSIILNLVEVR
ncbi:MAG: glycosyltransferase family 39 protein [Anaerolineae bacterium]|nr:glycosyltransferase family 39 protein [Anaerolineae bacterium]